jgi:glycerol uptake facilitator-like aquaporin|tara:strand:+ start:1267 stop:1533 length:267 start_codon:yes stop_codon:yes gene_type:complete
MYNYLAEFLGTGVFVYSILLSGNALVIGLTLALVILATASLSGGHINPAVTVVMASINKLPMNDVIPYLLCQIFGGLCAVEVFKRYRP